MSEKTSRRLAAIMAADIAGYSRLMAEDEAGTLERLRRFRSTLLEPTVDHHGGAIVKNMGDGWLAEFGSAVEAVNCATAIQARLAEDASVDIRIGIHVGDIVHEDEDIFGDGVNIAARLQQLAAPGAVLLSGDAYKFVDRKQDTVFESAGTHRLKNIVGETPVFGWAAKAGPLLSAGQESRSSTGVPVILVEELSLSGQEEEASDLAEEFRYVLVSMLSRRTGIRVLGERTPQAAPKYVISGRCRVSSSKARLDMVMTAAGGQTLWAERFENTGEDPDIFAQNAARRVSAFVRTHTSMSDGADVGDLPDDQLSTEELLAKAAYHNVRWDRQSVEIARKSLEAALRRSPDNPTALGMLAMSHIGTLFVGNGRLADLDVPTILEHANRAVSLGPNSDFVFMARANCRLWLLRDYPGARSDLDRALKINPDYADAQVLMGIIDIFSDEPSGGADRLVDMLEMMSENLLFPVLLFSISLGYLLGGNAERALSYAREAYERAPSIPNCGLMLAAASTPDAAVIGAVDFQDMAEKLDLDLSIVDNLPLKNAADTALLRARLEAAGIPG